MENLEYVMTCRVLPRRRTVCTGLSHTECILEVCPYPETRYRQKQHWEKSRDLGTGEWKENS